MTSPVMYLSGPISHSDTAQVERHKQAFRDAATALRARGLTVVSPVELCPQDGKPWEWYMRRCIAELVKCDQVVMLPRWGISKGACLEHDIAMRLDMCITRLDALLELMGDQ